MAVAIDKKGTVFILSKEAIILRTYPDPGTGREPWTIGGGHTSAAGGEKVVPGMVWTIAKSIRVAREDLARVDVRVNRAITRNHTQNVHNGFASADFNSGSIFSGSYVKKWNAGDETGSLATLGLYVNAAGKRLAGLVTRRQEEIRIIRDGVYPPLKVLVQENYRDRGRLVDISDLPFEDPPTVTTVTLPVPVPEPPRKAEPNVFMALFDLITRGYKWLNSSH